MTMDKYPELFAQLKDTVECLEDLKKLGPLLPPEDEDLWELIEWLVVNRHQFEFHMVFHAALIAKRPPDVKVFKKDIRVLDNANLVLGLVTKCKGDVPGFLMAIGRNPLYTPSYRAACLLGVTGFTYGKDPKVTREQVVAAALELQPDLVPTSKRTTVVEQTDNVTRFAALVLHLNHPDLPMPLHLVSINVRGKKRGGKGRKQMGQDLMIDKAGKELEYWTSLMLMPADRLVPPTRGDIEPPETKAGTVRRDKPKVNRNAPCPCKSGKKYKRCCLQADEEREKAGKSMATDQAKGHRGKEHLLTSHLLSQIGTVDLGRLDFKQVPEHLLPELAERFVLARDYLSQARLFEAVGVTDDLEDLFIRALRDATRSGEIEALKRLAKTVAGERLEAFKDCLHPKLALVAPGAREQAGIIEAALLDNLDDPTELSNYAAGLMWWKMPALGIALARAALASGLDSRHAEPLGIMMGRTRKKLDLPEADPADHLVAKIVDDKEEELAIARELDAAQKQVHKLLRQARKSTEAHAALEAELAANQGALDLAKSASQSAPISSEQEEKLKARNQELRARLAETHRAKSELKQKLQGAEELLQTQKAELEAVPSIDPDAQELGENELLGEEVSGAQPMRIPVFPERFDKELERFPAVVSRELMRVIGGMAAGDKGAFAGTRRLISKPEFHRQKVKRNYRVILRLTGETLEVIELLNRKDFERRIERL